MLSLLFSPSSQEIIVDIIGSTCSLLILASAGAYLARVGLLNQEKLSYLSKLVEELFSPCLIFSSFVKTLDISQTSEWLTPMLLALVAIIQGMFVGYTANRYVLKDALFEATIILGSGLAMTTNVQLNLSRSLEEQLVFISSDYEAQATVSSTPLDRAIKYTMIFTFVNTIARWTFAKDIIIKLKAKHENATQSSEEHYYFNEPNRHEHHIVSIEIDEKRQHKLENSHIPRPEFIELQTIQKKQELKCPLIESDAIQASNTSIQSVSSKQSKQQQNNCQTLLPINVVAAVAAVATSSTTAKKQENSTQSTSCLQILNSHPIQAAILSIFVCLFPQLRSELITPGTFINQTIFQSTVLIGGIIMPLVLMTLGGNLYVYSQRQKEEMNIPVNERIQPMSGRTLAGVTVIRLLIMPIIGAVTLYVLNYLGYAQDPVLQFIALISYSVPSAINLLTIATLYFPKSAPQFSNVLLTGSICNIATLPVILLLFFSYFS